VEIEHVLKKWEKKYGYLGLLKDELKLFEPVMGKRFTLKILGRKLYERKVEVKQRRIWVSHGALRDLEVGDILIIGRGTKGNFYIRRKKT